ncbi:hypothetical protein ACIRL0_10750 [Streptomyces sp. NPDC102365]|uniref:hypothetical protein n=1 Tax=Streptomyces sp. NPDC102365 TaxID=3366162 RepID=UPI00380F3674
MKRGQAFLAGIGVVACLAVASRYETGGRTESAGPVREPVQVTRCATDQGTTMGVRAVNDYPDPTAYVIQLYWFNESGRQVDGVTMTTDSIAPGKFITFDVTGRRTGEAGVRACDVKVLGVN